MRINDIVASSQGFQESLYCENFIYPAFTTLRDSVCVGIVGPFSLYAWVLYFLTFMMCPGVYFGIIGAKRQLPDAETELDGSLEPLIGELPLSSNDHTNYNVPHTANFGSSSSPPVIGFGMTIAQPPGRVELVTTEKPFNYARAAQPNPVAVRLSS